MPKDGPGKSDKPGLAKTITHTNNPLLKAKAIDMRAQGVTTQAIADELGVARQTVSAWLNSRDVKEIINEGRARLKALIAPSIDVYAMSLKNAPADMTNAQKAARDVLKNFGLLKDQVDIAHTFPRPTVIKRVDGTEVVFGTKDDNDTTGNRESPEGLGENAKDNSESSSGTSSETE